MAKYRIVTDRHAGYEAQYRPWWCPFWLQCARKGPGVGWNTHLTVEDARLNIKRHAAAKPAGTVVERVEVPRG